MAIHLTKCDSAVAAHRVSFILPRLSYISVIVCFPAIGIQNIPKKRELQVSDELKNRVPRLHFQIMNALNLQHNYAQFIFRNYFCYAY